MTFSERLAAHPVAVEVVPPSVRAKPAAIEQALGVVGEILAQARVDAVNVPEILGSGFQSMDALEFGLLVRERFHIDVLVNKVTVHEPREKFQAWLDRALAADVSGIVLVGGERSGIYYPGPGVIEANRLARATAERANRPDFLVGNVTIASRPQEAARMLSKIRAGCDFFTSQIVYEAASPNAHLQAYDDVCAFAGLEPKPLLYAFSPVETAQDILFLRYLGVNIPAQVERDLLAPAGSAGNASLAIIEDVWDRLLTAAREREIGVPLGVLVETVSRHNAASTYSLVCSLQKRLSATPLPAVSGPLRADG